MRSMRAMVLVATAMTGVAACGGSDFAGGTGRPSGRTFGPETWYDVQPGSSPDEVVLRFDGPESRGDEDCVPDRGVLVKPVETGVEITVQRFAPSPVITCPT